MNKLTALYQKFAQGRYGHDALYYVLLVTGTILWGIGLIAVQLGWMIVGMGLIVWAFYRALSRNIAARKKEDIVLLTAWNRVKGWFRLQRDRIRDREHVYAKCPNCRAILRLPRQKGKHTATCPRCRNRFEVRVFFGK